MKDRKGALGEIGLPGLLHLIYLKQDETAVLDLIKEPLKKRFFFRKGVPVAASSNILGEVLGRLLMQEGIISQKQYEDSLEVVLREKKRHGEVLISMGLLTPERLDEFLRLQLKRRLLKIFEWEEGSYRYMKTGLPQNLPECPLHPAELILEGISLGFYPVSKIKASLKPFLDKRLVLRAGAVPYKIDDFRLNLQEKRFVDSFKGEESLEDALASTDLLRHRALSIALSLIFTGVLRDSEGPLAEPPYQIEESREAHPPEAQVDSRLNAELLFMRAKTALQNKDFRSAIEILKEITNINPAEGEYWAHLGWAVYNDDPGRISEAEGLLKDSLDLNGDLDSGWYYLGRIFLVQGKTDLARGAFSTALSKNPWNTEALSELKRTELNGDIPARAEDPFAGFPSEPSLTGSQSSALDALAKAVRKRTGPALLECGAGSGKTTVVVELLKRISQDKVLAAVILRPGSKELEFIKDINKEMGCQSEAVTAKEQLLNLGMRMSQNKIQGGQSLLVIDEAHSLSKGCLKLVQYLSRLKTLQIVLSAGPGLSSRLKEPEFKELDDRLASRVTIGRMALEEASTLINSRLRAARPVKGAPALTSPDIEDIFRKAGGDAAALLKEASTRLRAGPAVTGPSVFEAAETAQTHQKAPPAQDAVETEEYDLVFESSPSAAHREGEPSVPEGPLSSDAAHPDGGMAASAPGAGAQAGPAVERTGQTGEEPHIEKIVSVPAARPGKRSLFKLLLWILLMLAAGLAAGSLIGTFLLNQ